MKEISRQVGEYLTYCENVRGMSIATIRMKRNVIWRFVEMTGIDSLNTLDNRIFNEWVDKLWRTGVSPRSINSYSAIIIAMVRYCKEIGEIIPIKLVLIKKLKEGRARRKFYTYQEIEKAISYADFETELMIRIMAETGMRIAELTYLKIDDFAGRKIRFIGKGKKFREAYVGLDTLSKISRYIMNSGRCSGYLFASLNGEPPTIATIRRKLRKPFYAAGFNDFYPHALRHSFATNLQLRGASVAEIKEMIGHESIATTERYLHGLDGRLEELFNKYG